jgi:hypothetical protein
VLLLTSEESERQLDLGFFLDVVIFDDFSAAGHQVERFFWDVLWGEENDVRIVFMTMFGLSLRTIS